MKKFAIILYLIFVCILLLVVFTSLSFANKSIAIFIFTITLSLSLIIGLLLESKLAKMFFFVSPILLILFLGVLIFINPFGNNFLSFWETVAVSHRKMTKQKTFVAIQNRDMGALGYRKRIVEVTPYFFLISVGPIDTTKLDENWKRVNEEYNPFNWKY